MAQNKGFSLLEIVCVLLVLGVLAIIAVPKYTDTGVETLADAAILKDSLRQTIMRAMADLSTANWNIVVASKSVGIYKDTSLVSSYSLSVYSGSFSISFNNLGQPQGTYSLPYSITIDSETGYIP